MKGLRLSPNHGDVMIAAGGVVVPLDYGLHNFSKV